MIFRVQKTEDYTIMSNFHLRDKNLSLKSVGLLSKILSLPDDWDFSMQGLCGLCKENSTAIKNSLEELRDCGYISIKKLMPNETSTGRIEYVYDIFECPTNQNQGIENLGVENQKVENPIQLNTNIPNTKKLNTPISPLKKTPKYSKEIYEDIVDFMNNRVSTDTSILNKVTFAYKATNKNTQKLINARLDEGYTVEDFKDVIFYCYKEWVEEPKQFKNGQMSTFYYRPSTMFNATNFESYLNDYRTKTMA